MDWKTYYDKFDDWAPSTQINRMSSLTSFGPSAEVEEIALEFQDEKVAGRFIRKALAYGVQFTPDEILSLTNCCDRATMNNLLDSSQVKFTQEELEDLWGLVDDEVVERAAARNHVTLFADEEEEEEPEEDFFPVQPCQSAPKVGFFTKLMMAFAGVEALSGGQSRHPGRCTGDCASCPPHYGYRYGRWYYGHGHVHGCEFGGNKGGR